MRGCRHERCQQQRTREEHSGLFHTVDPRREREMDGDDAAHECGTPTDDPRHDSYHEHDRDQTQSQTERQGRADESIAAAGRPGDRNQQELPERMEPVGRVDAVEGEPLPATQTRCNLQVVEPVVRQPGDEPQVARVEDREQLEDERANEQHPTRRKPESLDSRSCGTGARRSEDISARAAIVELIGGRPLQCGSHEELDRAWWSHRTKADRRTDTPT